MIVEIHSTRAKDELLILLLTRTKNKRADLL